MNFLKKFNGISDKADFSQDNRLMILTSNRKGQEGLRTLSVLISDGDTSVIHRIANNVPAEVEADELFEQWVANNGGSPETISGSIFANHNITGMGRPIILNNDSVQVDKDADGKYFVVSRFARWYPDGKKDSLTEELNKAVSSYERLQNKAVSEMKLFKEMDDNDSYKKATKAYFKHRDNAAVIDEKILCLETPYIAGTSNAIVTQDEKLAKEAFKNSGMDFTKFFPDGLAGGVDPDAQREAESDPNIPKTEEQEQEQDPHKTVAKEVKEKATA